jgi:cleavage and polyadenylation specificity factor subunit 3
MLQNGLSRELFELWCSDKKNGVIIPGYCVEGTLARTILSEPSHVCAHHTFTISLSIPNY